MESFENILPQEYSLNQTVEFYREDLDELFEDNREAYGDIIDPNNEIRHDIVTMGKFADFCGGIFADSEDQQEDISRAVYRSICFADQVANDTLPGNYKCEFVTYMNGRLEEFNSVDVIIEDVQEYLQHRDELDGIIGYYAPEVDPTDNYPHMVELFSGMFFMLAERSIGEQYTQAQLDNLTPEDIINNTL